MSSIQVNVRFLTMNGLRRRWRQSCTGYSCALYRCLDTWQSVPIRYAGFLLFLLVLASTAALFVHFFSRPVSSWPRAISHKTRYELTPIDVPNYLLIDMNDNKQPQCAGMYVNIVPNLQQTNVTDKELIKSIVGSSMRSSLNLNPAYLRIDIKDKPDFSFKSKYCANSTEERIFFFVNPNDPQALDDSKISQSTVKNMTENLDCVDFDSSKCQRIEPDKGRLKLFELDKQMIIKRQNWRNGEEFSTFVDILYRFVRRTAPHYSPEKNQWVKSFFHAVNITFHTNWVYEDQISLNISASYQKEAVRNLPCQAYLQNAKNNKIQPFVGFAIVKFDQLRPSTVYNICADCAKIDSVCVEVKTKSASFSSFREVPEEPTSRFRFIILVLLILVAMIICVFGALRCKGNGDVRTVPMLSSPNTEPPRLGSRNRNKRSRSDQEDTESGPRRPSITSTQSGHSAKDPERKTASNNSINRLTES